MQTFVNRGFEEATIGLLGIVFVVAIVRNERHRRRRSEYSWNTAYQPTECLAAEVEPLIVEAKPSVVAQILNTSRVLTFKRLFVLALCIAAVASGGKNGYHEYRLARSVESGKMQMTNKNYGAAEAEFRRVAALDPFNIAVHLQLGDCYVRQNRWLDAIPELLKVVNSDHADVSAYVMLGDCMYALKRDEDAEEQYRTALRMSPGYADAYYKLSVCLTRMGRSEDAIRELRRLVHLDPKNVRAHATLGRALLSIGFRDEGMDHLERAAALEPDNVIGLRALADGYVSEGRYADAADQLRAALAIDPEYSEDYFNLGYVLKKLNDTRGALDAYRIYVAIRTHKYTPVKPVLAGPNSDSQVSSDDKVASSDPASSSEIIPHYLRIKTAMAQLQELQYTRRISMTQ